MDNRQISLAEQEKVTRILKLFFNLQSTRTAHANQWEETAALIQPAHVNTFFYGAENMPGTKKTERQVDSTGMIALSRFAAICDSLLTPRNQKWHFLESDDPYLNKQRRVKLWFEEATRLLFKFRYAATSNFSAQNQAGWKNLGAYGTAGLLCDKLHNGRGLRYRDIPCGELYIWENHQGQVVGYIRWFRLTGQQAMGVQEWRGRLPDKVVQAAAQDSQTKFNFLQYVAERGDYDPERIDYKGMKFESCYVSVEGKCLLEEGGYSSFPLAASRYEQFSNEVYGRGPATFVLPALKTLNAQKRLFLKQGNRAADPVLLYYDDGMTTFNLKPGAMNAGGMSADGRRLIDVLPNGGDTGYRGNDGGGEFRHQ